MKKAMILLMVLTFCLMSSNVFAAAAALATGGATTTGGGELAASTPATQSIARLSNNVNIGVQYASTGYALSTLHASGTKIYGTAYDSTALYFQDVGVGGTLTAPSSSLSSEAFGTGWTKM